MRHTFGALGKKRTIVLLVLVATVLALLFLYAFRAPLSEYAWREHRVLRDAALALNPKDAMLRVNVGEYYFNVHDEGVYDLALAERYFIEALQIDPNINWAWYNLGHLSFIRGDFASAIYRLNKQIELHGPHEAQGAYYIRALTYAFDQQYEKAIEDYHFFLSEVNPVSVWAMNDLAWVYIMKEDFEAAYETAKRGLDIMPENPWLLTMAGVSLLNLNRNEEAVPYLEKAYERSLTLTESDWGRAYPNNDPAIRGESLAFMRETIRKNLELARGE